MKHIPATICLKAAKNITFDCIFGLKLTFGSWDFMYWVILVPEKIQLLEKPKNTEHQVTGGGNIFKPVGLFSRKCPKRLLQFALNLDF